MERLTILAPGVFGVAMFVVLFIGYAILHARGHLRDLGPYKSNEVLGPFWAGFMAWLLRPVERALVVLGVAPLHLTVASLVLCACAGTAIALGALGSGAWLYIVAGILDILDGRLARATGRESRAGALFDSVADRWGELAMFAGFAWYLRAAGLWLLAVMLAVAGSVMVSYTRARAEALGVRLRGGAMQRAERLLLVSAGTLVAAWFAASEQTEAIAADVLGLVLAVCGVLSCTTALGRWHTAYRVMRAREPEAVDEPAVATKPGAAR